MAQPSKAGAIFVFLFGSFFFGFGAFATFAFYTSSPAVHQNSHPLAGAIFASVFAIIGAGLMIGSISGYLRLKHDATVNEENPDSPWLWRKDWAESRAISKNRNTIYGWWIGTALLSMAFGPFVVTQLPTLLRNSDPKAFLLIGFGLMPAIVFIGALRATIRRERYGRTYFEFASLPFSPGKRFSGQIHLRLDTAAQHGIDLRLSCIRRIVTGSGKQQSTSEISLWQEERNVPQNSVLSGPLGASIPVDFDIAEEVYETNHDVPSDQVMWMLHAQADVPGVNYSDDFEVPVFRVTAKAAHATASALDSGAGVATFFGPLPATKSLSDSADIPTPKKAKVVVSITPEGASDFYFPAFRNRGRTLFLLLFTAVWNAIVYFLLHSKAPRFFAVAFGFFDLLLIYGCLQGLFGRAWIVVGGGKLISRKATLGKGATREIPFSDIDCVQAAAGVQQSGNGINASFTIRLLTKTGGVVNLVDSIADRDEARWIVAQIEKLIGLGIDTHVVLQEFGRDLGPPPQRGSF